MFKKLADEIKKLNANVSDVANSEKAKKLRKNLLIWGAVLSAVGFIGVFVCFILFTVGSFSYTPSFEDNSFPVQIWVPFFLIIPLAFAGATGVSIFRLGLSIVIGGVTTKFVDDNLNIRCSKCGDTVENDEMFCTKCGTKVRYICPNCQTEYSLKDDFCKKCGKSLK